MIALNSSSRLCDQTSLMPHSEAGATLLAVAGAGPERPRTEELEDGGCIIGLEEEIARNCRRASWKERGYENNIAWAYRSFSLPL